MTVGISYQNYNSRGGVSHSGFFRYSLLYLKSLFLPAPSILCVCSFGEYPETCRGCPELFVPAALESWDLWLLTVDALPHQIAVPGSCSIQAAPLFCGSKMLRETALCSLGCPRSSPSSPSWTLHQGLLLTRYSGCSLPQSQIGFGK